MQSLEATLENCLLIDKSHIPPWAAPITTTGKLIRKQEHGFDVQVEITSGPFNGRKAWGVVFASPASCCDHLVGAG